MRALIYRIQLLCQRIIPSEAPTKDEITFLVQEADAAYKALLTDYYHYDNGTYTSKHP